jgi:7-cyano-7-deazaguanine synthase
VAELLEGASSLTNGEDVPDGHYAEENMKKTIVPNRNSMMLNIAASVAIAKGYNKVYTGVHAGDHFIYPDCRPEFINALNDMLYLANQGMAEIYVQAPFMNMTKAEIAKAGELLGVRFAETWSCYKGGELHCGRCGTCVERAEAFAMAGVYDPTVYEDSDFWKTVTKENVR